MKFGLRTTSLKKRIAARTSWKRVLRHNLGFKAPRGWGWLTNPKKAAYNRVYSRTTVDAFSILGRGRRGKASGPGVTGGLVLLAVIWAVINSPVFKAMVLIGAGVAALMFVGRALSRRQEPRRQEMNLELDYARSTLGESAPPQRDQSVPP